MDGNIMGQLSIEVARQILSHPEYNINICIETGTRNGMSSQVWANLLSEVHTIEVRKSAYLKAKKLNSLKNIYFYLGDSSKVLPDLIKNFHQPVLLPSLPLVRCLRVRRKFYDNP